MDVNHRQARDRAAPGESREAFWSRKRQEAERLPTGEIPRGILFDPWRK